MGEHHAIPKTLSDGMLSWSLVLGTLTFLGGALLAYWAVMGVRSGAQTEALMALFGVVPLLLVTVIVFAVGSATDRSDAPRRRKSRLVGLLLGAATLPLWLSLSFFVLAWG